MGGNRSTRRAGYYEHEDFENCSYGTNEAALGGFSGYRVYQDGEYGYINLYIPKNFARLMELEVFFIPYATATPMYMGVVTDYCQDGEAYFEHNENMLHKSVNTVLSRGVELDVLDCVDVAPVEGGDYIGIQINRTAGLSPAHNTNALVVGARYKMLLSRKAET